MGRCFCIFADTNAYWPKPAAKMVMAVLTAGFGVE
jgi:hypothetical protein